MKMFSIPHSNGSALDIFLFLSSFNKIGKLTNRIPITKVHLRVKICVIID